jgi:hypothetical protein
MVPENVQPEGLYLSHDETYYVCPDCVGIYYPVDDECVASEIPHCSFAVAEDYCTACVQGYHPLTNICVPSTGIMNCMTPDPYNGTKCDACYAGYSLTWDQSHCLDCPSFENGCSDCRTSWNTDTWDV